MNAITLIGTVSAPPKFKTTDNGFNILNFRIKTVDEYMTSAGEVKHRDAYHRVVVWGNLAKLRSGLREEELVALNGRLQTRVWQDNKGIEREVTEVVAGNLEVLVASEKPAPAPAPAQDEPPAEDFSDDDIPF
jgi:single-strand DNA-binding protein